MGIGWEPCSRCGSKRVKRADESSYALAVVALLWASFLVAFLGYFIARSQGGASLTWLVIPFMLVIAVTILAAAIYYRFRLRCEDCARQWRPGPA